MLAAPIVNPITILSTYKAFSGQQELYMTLSRVGLGYIIALIAGFIIFKIPSSKLVRQDLMRPQEGHDHQHGGLTMALRSAMKDFVDIAVYFSLGVAITALFNTGVAPGREALNSLAGSPILGPAAMMGVAFFLSLCSTSDAFIAASLSHFTKGAKLAFMVFGPMFDLKLLFLYRSLFKTRVIIILGISLFIAIGALSILWAAFIPS